MSGPHGHDDAAERELVAYALGDLDPAERERLEQLLARDGDLQARLTELTATTLALSQLPGEAWELEEPPPPPALDPGTRVTASTRVARARHRGILRLGRREFVLRPLTLAVAATTLVALGALIGVVVRSSSGSTRARILASARLAPIDDVDPSARAVFGLTSAQTARFAVSGLAPTDKGHVYELWLMDSTSDLISVATFRVNSAGSAHLTLALPTSPSHFHYLDVSLQPLDGVALHSKTSVLRGATPA
jgi:anti-sigma-K factor RskA